jgi:CubicO group peptidase (beta-lactamase class C family)
MRTIACSAIVVALAAAAGPPDSPSLARPAPITAEAFSACFDAQARTVPFSGVALAQRGDQSLFRAAGYADADSKVPISQHSRFRLASVQKVVTRVAIGLLVEQGRVDLGAPIGRYLPGLPAQFAAITAEQLLQHRSGVAPFTNLRKVPPEVRAAYFEAKTARARLTAIASQPLSFAPGTAEEYSNAGYEVLGALIEAVSGRDYGAFVEEALYRPLEMGSTDLVPDAGTAVRFTRMGPDGNALAQRTAAVDREERRGSAAGDGVSSADDLAKLGKALLGDRLLSPEVKARLFPRRGDVWRIGQSGGSIGANTDFSAYPESGWVVTVLSNYDPPTGELMGEVLRTYVLGKGCRPLSENDRPSPMRRLAAPGPNPGAANPPRIR